MENVDKVADAGKQECVQPGVSSAEELKPANKTPLVESDMPDKKAPSDEKAYGELTGPTPGSEDPSGVQDIKEGVSDSDEASLKRAQFGAEQGSEFDQAFLGKHLLKQAEIGINAVENGEKAIDWLIKASKQGNEEATRLLRECLDKDMGITPMNREDVQWCVETSNLEKSARLAAKNIFRRLNPLATSEITKQDYLSAISSGEFNKQEKKLLEGAGKFKESDSLSEEAFVNKVIGRLQGSGGTTLSTLLQKEDGETFHSASYARKIFYYPGKSLAQIADSSVEYAAKQGMGWLKSLIPTQQIHMLLVFFLYSVLSIHFFMRVLPLFFFYFALLTMIVCTLQMFYGKRKLKDVQALAQMLNRFNETVDTDNAVSAYTWQSLTPYISFFIALFICLVSFSLVDKSWIPCSEIVCIGMFFTMTCFGALSDQYDYLVILSIIANFISTLPTMIANFPQIPVVYHLLQLFAGSVFSLELIPGVAVNFGLPSAVYMVVPFLFLKMALQKSGQGTYRVLIPHLVCFFWWQLSMVMFRHSSWLGLIRGSIGWVMLIVLAPLLGFILCVYAFYYFAQLFTIAGILKLITTLFLLSIPAVLGFWAKKGFVIKGFSLSGKTGKIILVVLSVFTVFPMMYFIGPQEVDVGGEYLTWEEYARFCSYPQWEKTSIADAQIKCSHLTNVMVAWTGKVKKVVIKKVDNGGDNFVNLLPVALGNWLRCTYGDAYPVCADLENLADKQLCGIYTIQNRHCHMKTMDYYTFELWVSMVVDADTVHDIRIEAMDSYKNVLLQLQLGEEVSFRASLVKELGNTWPVLRMVHVRSMSREHVASTYREETDDKGPMHVLLLIQAAIYDTLNFFLYPVMEFGRGYELAY